MRRAIETVSKAAIAIATFVIVAVGFPGGFAGAATTAAANVASTTYYESAPAVPKSAEVVYVGIEPIQVEQVDLSDDTFQTSFYIWWRWKGPIDPVSTSDIYNSTASSANYVVQYSYTDAAGIEKPTKLSDGFEYQTAKISTGVSDPFSVSRYPLDSQNLQIRLENNTYDFDQLVYVPDTANMTKHPNFEVAGWNVKGESMTPLLHQYGTNFGVLGAGAAASRYSQLSYSIDIGRPLPHFIWKLLLPLMIVLITAFGALFIKTDESDIRPLFVGTALLALIFLQQAYSTDLPPTVPVVTMDEIYALSYVTLVVIFVQTIFTMNKVHHEEEEPEAYVKHSRKLAIATGIVYLIGVTLLIFI